MAMNRTEEATIWSNVMKFMFQDVEQFSRLG